MALAESASLLGFIVAFFGSFLGMINLWYTREKTKVLGPRINIPYIEFDEIKEKKSETGVRLNVLFQNVGDRISFLIIRKITIKKTMIEEDQKSVVFQPSIDEEGLMFQPQAQKIRNFDIKVPLSRDELENSEIMISTMYTDHVGNLIEKGWKFRIDDELVGNLVSIWKNEKVLQKEQRRINFAEHRIEQTSFKEIEENKIIKND
ncbi:MAG: hypothetical protein HGN29_09325 [Asgard group archaeon]|nr:hypothetical protein [Asgard group archaeon]